LKKHASNDSRRDSPHFRVAHAKPVIYFHESFVQISQLSRILLQMLDGNNGGDAVDENTSLHAEDIGDGQAGLFH
jgi:hypothetical protein